MWLTEDEGLEAQMFKRKNDAHRAVTKALTGHEEAEDVSIFSNEGKAVGAKVPTSPMPLSTLPPQLMSLFNTVMAPKIEENAVFTKVVDVLEGIPNLDFDANLIMSSALGIYYETSKRVQFRVGLHKNPKKETILDCRRLKGDSFVMGNFFTILTTKMSAMPELGVTVVYEEEESIDFFDDDEDDVEELDALLGQGHLRLENDPKLVKHLMKEIESSDLETQVNDTGLLAHAAELESNVKTLATEGGAPLVKILEGKLQHNNAALVRQSAVLLKELTRMHPEIFSESTAKSMVQAMGKWAEKPVATTVERSELVSSRSTVSNLAEGISALMQAEKFDKSIQLEEDRATSVIHTLQKYPTPERDMVVNWLC
jgi:hypothetical protein